MNNLWQQSGCLAIERGTDFTFPLAILAGGFVELYRRLQMHVLGADGENIENDSQDPSILGGEF